MPEKYIPRDPTYFIHDPSSCDEVLLVTRDYRANPLNEKWFPALDKMIETLLEFQRIEKL